MYFDLCEEVKKTFFGGVFHMVGGIGIIYISCKMSNIIRYFEQSYYAQLLTLLIAIWGLLVSLSRKVMRSYLNNFFFYFLSYIIISIAFIVISLFMNSKYSISAIHIGSLCDFLFTILEYVFFGVFFRQILPRSDSLLIYMISSGFFLLTLAFIYNDVLNYGFISHKSLQKVFITQAASLIILCCKFFLNNYTALPSVSLKRDSRFWIVAGLSCLLVSTLPFSIFMNYLEMADFNTYRYLYAIIYFFYSILFITIIKAMRCVKESVK